jgi:hypothetical protein
MNRNNRSTISTLLTLVLLVPVLLAIGGAPAFAQDNAPAPAPIDEGFFPFSPPRDTFVDNALMDLRFLNQEKAGQDGWVQNDNGRFVFEQTKQPVKFWGVNGTTFWTKEPWGGNHADVDFQARRLAKIGVNLVRIFPNRSQGAFGMTPAHIDALQYQVAAFAKQGIYSHVCFFWNFESKISRDIPGYKTGANIPTGVLFYDKNVQEIYKDWARQIYAAPDPYSGVPLGKNPAVAIIEIENEDNHFFWSFNNIKTVPAESRVQLQKQYAAWLTQKYGSLEKAQEAWGPTTGELAVPDDWQNGQPGFYIIWLLTGEGVKQANRKRASDQAQFLTEQLQGFFAKMNTWYREEFGYAGTISATNWTTADNRTLGALDKYADMACDVLDRHAYHDTSKGNGGGGISPNSYYSDESLMKGPDSLTRELRFVGYPHIMTEYNYPMPNRFRAEFPWMAAVYGSLDNTDSFSYNELYGADWLKTHNRFSAYSPVVLGQFPALSVVFRKGYVEAGPVVYREGEKPEDLYKLNGTRVFLSEKLDELRKAQAPAEGQKSAQGLDAAGYYVGQVELEISENPKPDVAMDLSKYIDQDKKIVKSATGQLVWDWAQGLATCNAPCAQGATGFFPTDKDVTLGDVKFHMGNDYASVMLVSLDGQPLATSAKMLLQVVTDDRNNGWQTQPATFERDKGKPIEGLQVKSLGSKPDVIVVRKIAGTVGMTRADAAALKVTALDYNGYARQEIAGGAGNVVLLPDCLYYVIAKP